MAVRFFNEKIVSQFGTPGRIISDRGPAFTSHLWKNEMAGKGVEHALCTTEHAQSNGLTEKVNGVLVDRLAAFAVDRPDKWDRLLPSAIATLNTGVHVGHHLQSGGRASEPDQKEMEYLSGSCRPAEKILRPDLCRAIHG